MFKVYPYKMGSASGKLLATALDAKRVRPNGRYRYRPRHIVVNWGNSTMPNWICQDAHILNMPVNVGLASNKLKTLTTLRDHGVPCLTFTTSWDEASDWDEDGWNGNVYARFSLTGHSGEGIQIYTADEVLPHDAKLFTKGIDNHGEYRVHVFQGEVIDYRKRSRAREDEPTRDQGLVRTHDNGWIFRQDNLRRLERIEDLAIHAMTSLGLDFGAVDIIKDENGDVFVCEVNTAPSMETRTLQAYVNKFLAYATTR
jgi:hypothetical protein